MISGLPHEILLLISSHLASPADTLRLASCCQKFHDLLTPEVYNTVQLEDGREWHMSRLTHTLARNPQLAKLVRSLRHSDGAISCYHHGAYYDDKTIHPLLEAATPCSKELATWEKQLKADVGDDPWLAILLPLLTNLEELEMVIHWPSSYTRKMLQRITQGPPNPCLARLREVSVRFWDTEGGLRTSYVYPFFRLPSLRGFTGNMLQDGRFEGEDLHRDESDYESDYEGDEAKEAAYPGSECFSTVTRLHVHYSNSEKGLPDLISAPKRLESFVYEYNGSTGEYTPFDARAFYGSLCKHRESLAEITLCEDIWSYSVDEPVDVKFVGSFKDFTALRKLRLRGQNILDWEESGSGFKNTLSDVLPESLESLIIESFDECDSVGLTAELETLVRNINSTCPNLAVLEIKGHIEKPAPLTTLNQEITWPHPVPELADDYIEMTACLASLCRQARIRFRLWSPIMEERANQYEYWLEKQTDNLMRKAI
ncbi:hypothetical protein BJX99DRAFT_263808 [Aspergillus californicus]